MQVDTLTKKKHIKVPTCIFSADTLRTGHCADTKKTRSENAPCGKTCKFVAESGEVESKKEAHCKMVDKTTNSSDNLNIFKITLTLLIIFTIL